MRVWALLALLAIAVSAVQAVEKDQILVLVGSTGIQQSHSKYFSALQGSLLASPFSRLDASHQALQLSPENLPLLFSF